MTLAQVRSKTERIREFSALPFLSGRRASASPGAFFRPAPQAVTGGPINAGDVAWMLTATGLVLLMTPGPVVLLRRHGAAPRTSSRRCCRASSRWA